MHDRQTATPETYLGWIGLCNDKYGQPVQKFGEIHQALLDKWAEIPVERLQRLAVSVPRRLAAIIAARGENTDPAHYIDVIMGAIGSQITSLMVVYSTVYSDADQRKHQSSASLAFVWGIHRDRWIPRTKGQLRGICFHLMTSSWYTKLHQRAASCKEIKFVWPDLPQLPSNDI